MNGKEVIARLEAAGWVLNRIRGSHHVMKKDEQPSVPVPVHGKQDLPAGVISAIARQTGVKLK